MSSKKILIWFTLVIVIAACTKRITAPSHSQNNTTLSGKILKMEWTKSKESFCAQGSEYFVLQIIDSSGESNNLQNRIVLAESEAFSISQLGNYVNQSVTIHGEMVEKSIKYVDDEFSQRPINPGNSAADTFICQVFKVDKIIRPDK